VRRIRRLWQDVLDEIIRRMRVRHARFAYLLLVLILPAAITAADDKPRFSFEPRETPQQVGSNDLRPVVWMYKTPTCYPCNVTRVALLEHEKSHGLPFRLAFDEMPRWALEEKLAAPLFHWNNCSGTGETQSGWNGVEKFVARWKETQEMIDAPAAAQGAAQPGSSLIEQAQKYAGTSGSFVFQPDAQVRVATEDGTVVTYTQLRGRYAFDNGQPVLTLAPPFAHVDVKKFGLHFGADVVGPVRGELPAAVSVQTNRGKYRVELKQVE